MNKYGLPRAQRQKLIKDGEDDKANTHTHQVLIKGAPRFLKILRVPIEMPKYRIENGRTGTAQQEYIATNGLSADFFTKDPETNLAQQAQHKLLIDLMDAGVNLIREVKKPKTKQTIPLILTHDGYVLNGNRRLCAFRHVFFSDQKTYNHLKYIDVVVLPRLSEGELVDMEAQYQTAESWEKDYLWIDEAFLYRRNTQPPISMAVKTIALRDGKKPKDVKTLIDTISFVDDYLVWLGKPNYYSEVHSAEHSFRRLVENIGKTKLLPNPADREVFKYAVFQLIADRGAVGRAYTKIPELAKNIGSLRSKLRSDLAVTAKDDKALISKLKKIANQKTIRQVIIDVVDGAKTALSAAKAKEATISEIRKANTSLQNAISQKNSKSDLKGLADQIKAIKSSLRQISKW